MGASEEDDGQDRECYQEQQPAGDQDEARGAVGRVDSEDDQLGGHQQRQHHEEREQDSSRGLCALGHTRCYGRASPKTIPRAAALGGSDSLECVT